MAKWQAYAYWIHRNFGQKTTKLQLEIVNLFYNLTIGKSTKLRPKSLLLDQARLRLSPFCFLASLDWNIL